MLDSLLYHVPSTPLRTLTVSLGKEPPGSVKCNFLTGWAAVSLSRRAPPRS